VYQTEETSSSYYSPDNTQPAAQNRIDKSKEEEIPLRREVVGACEMLGIDPLYLANEGKVIAVVAPSVADSVLEAMRDLPEGKGSVKIGQVLGEEEGLVLLETDLGATRILGMLEGEPLPRIC
jgi:hydrogenase expression/formation protein HypE